MAGDDRTIGDMLSAAKGKLNFRAICVIYLIVSIVALMSGIQVYPGTGSASPQQNLAIAFGCICIVLAILMIVLDKALGTGTTGMQILTYFNIIWTFAVASAMTFDQPFPNIGNGYISVWACAFLSAYLGVLSELPGVDKVEKFGGGSSRYLNFSVLMNIILLVEMSVIVGNMNFVINSGVPQAYQPLYVYGLVAAVIGLILNIVMYFFVSSEGMIGGILAIFNLLWWIAGALALLFFGGANVVLTPTSSANGYFAVWGLLITAILIMLPQFESMGFDFFSEGAGGNSEAGGAPAAADGADTIPPYEEGAAYSEP